MTAPEPYVTPEEYLERERAAKVKSEYYDGRIYTMSGASRQHVRITVNTLASFHRQLRGRPCDAYSSDMRLNVSATGLYTYPDVAALCGEPRFVDDAFDTLLNPAVLVEVLSDSTEAYDRGRKFEHYRRIDTLRDYLLVAQDRVHVEHRALDADGRWTIAELSLLEDVVELPSIECTLLLADLYERVELPPRPALRVVREPVSAEYVF
jgi:Uma2 family endonuclease